MPPRMVLSGVLVGSRRRRLVPVDPSGQLVVLLLVVEIDLPEDHLALQLFEPLLVALAHTLTSFFGFLMMQVVFGRRTRFTAVDWMKMLKSGLAVGFTLTVTPSGSPIS